MKKFLIPLVCLFLLSSCVYTPVNDFFKIRNKGLSKDYSSLNNPAFFTLTATQEFSKGKKIIKEDFGTVHFIYDWENNEINDYFFTKTYNSVYNNYSFVDLKNSDGSKTYLNIDLSREIMKVNLKQRNFTTTNFDDDIGYYYLWANPSIESNKHAVLFYTNSYDIESDLYDCTFYIFSEDEKNDKKVLYKNINDAYDIIPIMDASGDKVWFNEIKSSVDRKDKKVNIKNLDLTTGTINEPFISFDSYLFSDGENPDYKIEKEFSYYVMFADSSYIILKKVAYNCENFESENSILMIDLSSKTSKEIKLDKDLYIQYVTYLNNKYYVFTRKIYGNYSVYTIDYSTENKTFIEEYSIKGQDIDSYFIRDDSIYFIDYEKNHSYISKFDSKSNKYVDLLNVKISDFAFKK